MMSAKRPMIVTGSGVFNLARALPERHLPLGTREAAMDAPHIRICQHCSIPYDWRRSPSGSLKMTYCGSLCERADLGFTIETLLHNTPVMRSAWKQLMAA